MDGLFYCIKKKNNVQDENRKGFMLHVVDVILEIWGAIAVAAYFFQNISFSRKLF